MRLASRSAFALALLASPAAVIAVACDAAPLDLGATIDASDEPSANAPATSAVGAWVGYVEAYQFADEDDHLRLTITSDADGGPGASVFLGSGASIAPPTDMNEGYPAGYWSGTYPYATTSSTGLPALVEGFTFTGRDVKLEDGGRVRLAFAQHEAWAAWCAGQTTTYEIPNGNGADDAGILPDGSITDGGNPPIYACCAGIFPGGDAAPVCDPSGAPADPGKVALCAWDGVSWPHCTCTATACGIDASAPDTRLDLQLGVTGDTLQGSISGLGQFGVPFPVYFARSQ